MIFLFPNLAYVRSLQGSLSLGIQSPSENANGTNEQYYAVRVGDDWHRKSSSENMTGFLGYSKIVFFVCQISILNFQDSIANMICPMLEQMPRNAVKLKVAQGVFFRTGHQHLTNTVDKWKRVSWNSMLYIFFCSSKSRVTFIVIHSHQKELMIFLSKKNNDLFVWNMTNPNQKHPLIQQVLIHGRKTL